MRDELFSLNGPEGRNQDAARFEDQLVAMSAALGWETVCRNIDLYIATGEQSRGIDTLWALRNPQTGRNEGWIGEAKRYSSRNAYTPKRLTEDFQALRDKLAKLQGHTERFFNHPTIREHIQDLRGGIIAHYAKDYDVERVRERLQDVTLQRMERGAEPTEIAFLGADALNGLAEVFARQGSPVKFFWPPTEHHQCRWSSCCPPEQLTAGLLAYKNDSNRVVLWVRDTLTHHDLRSFSTIAHNWGLDFNDVAFSMLTVEEWRLVSDSWRREARLSRKDGSEGRLPDAVIPLEVGSENMKEFNRQWPAAAAA